MISLTAAAKAAAVCVPLLSPDTLFCTIRDVDYICTPKGCQTEAEVTADWRNPEKQLEFLKQLYGYQEGKSTP